MKSAASKIIIGNAKIVRNINRAVILNVIREQQPISRAKIATLTRLNKSTVSSIVANLLEDGLVFEEVDVDGNIGRNPINLRLKLGDHFVGAINIDSHLTRMAIIDIDGSLVDSMEIESQPQENEQFIRICLDHLSALRDKYGLKRLKGVGVSVAGIVDALNLRVLYAPNLGWENFEIGQAIRGDGKFEGIIVIENDAKASALAEMWFGRHNIDLANFVFLSVGPGIGTGIVVDKKLVDGEHHAAGEFGHTVLFEGGELCSCGNHGCWEAYASDRSTAKRYAVSKRLSQQESQEVVLQSVIDAAKNGDEVAIQTLIRTGYYLGMGIANIIKAIDPKAIVIGGRITQVWELIYPEIMQVVIRRAFFGKERKVSIAPTSLAMRPRLLGAATLAIKELFSDYKIVL